MSCSRQRNLGSSFGRSSARSPSARTPWGGAFSVGWTAGATSAACSTTCARAEAQPLYPRAIPRALTTADARQDLADARELLRGIEAGPLASSPLGPILGALVSDIVEGLDRVEAKAADIPAELLRGNQVRWVEEHHQVHDVVVLAMTVLRYHVEILRILHAVAPPNVVITPTASLWPVTGRYGRYETRSFDPAVILRADDEEE
jgi:hypothetical protein